MRLEREVDRLLARLEEQDRADLTEIHRRTYARIGLPFDAAARADVEAYWRFSRTLPADLDFEEAIQRCANWWVDRLSQWELSAENIVASARQVAAEHTAGECPADCPICGT